MFQLQHDQGLAVIKTLTRILITLTLLKIIVLLSTFIGLLLEIVLTLNLSHLYV